MEICHSQIPSCGVERHLLSVAPVLSIRTYNLILRIEICHPDNFIAFYGCKMNKDCTVPHCPSKYCSRADCPSALQQQFIKINV